MLGVIGGTGWYQVDWIEFEEALEIDTPFGKPSAPLRTGNFAGNKLVFLPRHGDSHQFLPSEVNYRANIYALKSMGVDKIVSFSATGSLREDIRPGEMALPSQYFDFVKDGRSKSFFGDGLIAHVAMAEPVCPDMRAHVSGSASRLGIIMHDNTTYACVEGPRFGTRAESFFLKDHAKCDLVGMTNVPEAFLAREAQICYVSIAIPTDYDCWRDEPDEQVSVDLIIARYKQALGAAHDLLKSIIETPFQPSACNCRESLETALMFDPDTLTGKKRELMDVLRS